MLLLITLFCTLVSFIIESICLIKDIIFDDLEFEADEILRRTFPKIITKGKYIPIKKYQKKSGLSVQALEDLGLKKLMERSKKDYLKLIQKTELKNKKERLSCALVIL